MAKAGFNFYLTYLYDKQYMPVVDREPYYVCRFDIERMIFDYAHFNENKFLSLLNIY
jgi:hypothetical protein